MAIGDTYRIAVVSTMTGLDDFVNVFHYRQLADDLNTDTAAESLADYWEESAKPAYLHCMSARQSLRLLQVRQVTGGEEIYERTVTDNGDLISADVLPLYAAPVISWRTGLAGRSRRGRSYMPTVSEGYQDQGVLNQDMISNLEAFGAAALVLGEVAVDYWELVICSLYSNGQPRANPLITKVTSYIARELLGTQKRRTQGRGS